MKAARSSPLPSLTSPDYESRPSEHGRGSCSIYEDVLPGAPLRGSSHTVVMALQVHAEDRASNRQWLFNIGQSGTGAEHWLWNAHKNTFNVQFGAWNGAQIGTADLSTAQTLATTFDGNTRSYKLYLNGNLIATKEGIPLNINSGRMAIGGNSRQSNFLGCVQGVDVYRKALTDAQVA